jgi:hypothetical protein
MRFSGEKIKRKFGRIGRVFLIVSIVSADKRRKVLP